MNTRENRTVRTIAHVVLILLSLACILPFILMIMSSFTAENDIVRYGYTFLPRHYSLGAYQYLWVRSATIVRAYGITVLITAAGTLISLVVTMMLAYPLSRRDFPFRNALTFVVFFTLLFNGGLVPTYLLYTMYFHIKNTLMALLVPNLLMNGFNVLLARTFFMTNVPFSIIESASIDGAGEFKIFRSIVLPISLPIVATIGLFVGVGYWNDWYNGLIFLTDSSLFNIQNVLNNMLMNIQFLQQNSQVASNTSMQLPATTVKMAIAVVGVLPILVIYPFFQKYFVKGITIGAIKG